MSNFYVSPCPKPEYGEQILILLANEFNDVEFFYPYYRFIEEGYIPTVVGLSKTEYTGKNQFKFPVAITIDDVNPDDYDLLYIPGGYAPEHLRKSEKVLDLVRTFNKKHKPIVSLCHGPLVLLDAGIINGMHITCWPDLKDSVSKGGAIFHDQTVVRDHNLITSRYPADLPVFMHESLKILKSRL